MIIRRSTYKVFASSANLGSGFDSVAIAIDVYYDIADVTVKIPGDGRIKVTYSGPYGKYIMRRNGTCVIEKVFKEFIKATGARVDALFNVWKGIPPSSGLGSSGASASVTAYALNDLIGTNLRVNELIAIAGEGEVVAAGTPHYDNVAASMLGGLVIVGKDAGNPPLVKVWRINTNLNLVIAVPECHALLTGSEPKTAIMRSVLPKNVSLSTCVDNTFKVSALIAGILKDIPELIKEGLNDSIVTPYRKPHIPCYDLVKDYAIKSGAYGVAISGSGPSMIAIVSKKKAENIVNAVKKAYSHCGVKARVMHAKVAGPIRKVYRIQQRHLMVSIARLKDKIVRH